MKAIMMSIRPQYVTKILNGEKTIEIRKKFPSDYVGWVYIYCTKGGDMICYRPNFDGYACVPNLYGNEHFNGKVVARFWCDKVECAYNFYVEQLCQLACISKEELYKYAGGWYKTDDLLAIHITKLEIFDKPKDISEFYKVGYEEAYDLASLSWDIEEGDYHSSMKYLNEKYQLTRAPQSWCYIEV